MSEPWVKGSFVKVAEHVWEERDLEGNVVAEHWTTTKRDRNQQTTLALTEPEMPKRPGARPASLGVDPSVMGGSVSCSVSATTTEPGVTPDASRGPTANGKPAGPSDLVALNYPRGME